MLGQMERRGTGRDQSIWSSLPFLSTINLMEQNVGEGVAGEAEALGLALQKQHKPIRILE